MNAPLDVLGVAVAKVRPHLDRSIPAARRVRAFWAGVIAARKLGAADVVAGEFMELAKTSGLAADLGRHANEDLVHIIRWALLNRNPFGRCAP